MKMNSQLILETAQLNLASARYKALTNCDFATAVKLLQLSDPEQESFFEASALVPSTARFFVFKHVYSLLEPTHYGQTEEQMLATEDGSFRFSEAHEESPCRGCEHNWNGLFGCLNMQKKPQGEFHLYPNDAEVGRAQYFHAHPCPFRNPREQ